MSAIANRTISSLTEQWPFVREWLDSYHFAYDPTQTLSDCIARTPDGYFRDIDRTRSGFVQELEQYIRDISAFLGEEDETVETVSLLPGHDKRGVPEDYSRIDWRAG